MQLQQQFNANAIEPNQGGNFNQLPVGKYPVVATASEIKPTADGQGGMVVFELLAIPGSPFAGATGLYRINLYNASDKARQIAEGQMSALCHVTGVFLINDTSQLHNVPFVVEITEQGLTKDQQEKKDAGQQVTPFTQVKKVYDMAGNEPGKAAGGAPTPAPAQQQQPAQQAWVAPAQQAPAATGWAAPAQQQPAQQQVPAPAAAPAQQGWTQQAPAAGGAPAWGKR